VLSTINSVFDNGFPLDGNVGFIAVFILVVLLSACIAYVTYNLIEIPGIKLGKLIIKKL